MIATLNGAATDAPPKLWPERNQSISSTDLHCLASNVCGITMDTGVSSRLSIVNNTAGVAISISMNSEVQWQQKFTRGQLTIVFVCRPMHGGRGRVIDIRTQSIEIQGLQHTLAE